LLFCAEFNAEFNHILANARYFATILCTSLLLLLMLLLLLLLLIRACDSLETYGAV